VIDEQVHGQITPEHALALVDEIKTQEASLASASADAEQPSAEESHA